jgi:putative endonuclease
VLSSVNGKAAHLLRGKTAANHAQDYLVSHGLKPVSRNYRCKQGVLDLIMNDEKNW